VEEVSNPRQQLKIKIFEAYRNCINAPSPDILSKHSGQLWSLIQRWCKKCLFIDEKWNKTVEEMGESIYHVVQKLVKEDRTTKVFEKLDEFFMYMNRMLKNEMTKILYAQLPESVPKARVKKYFYINRLIETREREGKLTENERLKIISDYMTINEYIEIKKNILYPLELENKKKVDDEDNDINLLNYPNVMSVFNNDSEITNRFDVSPDNLQKAVTYVLENKRQKRTRACNRALFTVLCIKEAHDYLDKLAPVLDSELLSIYRKDDIKPTQYETYLKYHPERKESSKNSVESNASSDLDNFLDDLKTYLRENKT
jgi:hypothetical protein